MSNLMDLNNPIQNLPPMNKTPLVNNNDQRDNDFQLFSITFELIL